MPPSREDFAAWQNDPTTRYVVRALEADAQAQERAWRELSWVNGHANQLQLLELRTRADAYRAMAELNYDGLCEANGDAPNDE